jgi:hypothetical protein
LNCLKEEVWDIAFTPPSVGQAIVLRASPVTPSSTRLVLQADRFDMFSGQRIGNFGLLQMDRVFRDVNKSRPTGLHGGSEVFTCVVSPSGGLLALRQDSAPKRLDLWDLDAKKHLAAWLPDDERVDWFEFLDNERIFTRSKSRIVLWKVPECQPLYQLEGRLGWPSLSPNRQFLALAAPVGIVLLNAADGTTRGVLNMPPAKSLSATTSPCFSPNGEELTVKSSSILTKEVFFWERFSLSTGKHVGAMVATKSYGLPLAYVEPKLFLNGTALFHVDVGFPLAHYSDIQQGILRARTSPDGRLWLCDRMKGQGVQPAFLLSLTVPESKGRALADLASAGKVKPLLAPDTSVKLSVSGHASYTADIEKGLEKILQRRGLKSGPSPIRLAFRGTERAAGNRTFTLLDFAGKPTKENISVPVQRVEASIVLMDGNKKLKEWLVNSDLPESIALKGGSAAASITEFIWRDVAGRLGVVVLPIDIFRADGEAQTLPVNLRLNPRYMKN